MEYLKEIKYESELPLFNKLFKNEIKIEFKNILIEGENLEVLKYLQNNYKEMLDMIYIDPPYNTGTIQFKYKDKWSHEDWYIFMKERLIEAKPLLKEIGVIFISIDDHEFAQLKLLCDQIFGEENFIGNLLWHCNKSILKQSKHIRKDHEYILCYAKDKTKLIFNKLENNMEFENIDDDPKGPWFSSNATIFLNEKHKNYFGIELPNKDICYRTWKFSKEDYENKKISLFFKDDNVPRLKCHQAVQNVYTKVASSFLPNNIGTTTSAKNNIKEMFSYLPIEYPKPVSLIKYLISLIPNKNGIILDFFAGSGTTGHAVLELNKEDDGNRQFILCTNNENDICKEVCFPRLKKVITGYTTLEGEKINGIKSGFKYFKI